jgi:hypothetical protein
LNPCPSYKFQFKGIKKNALNNLIELSFVSWIKNVDVYVELCSLNAFDYIIHGIIFLKITQFILKGLQGKGLVF